jgi:tetratricopeptide (TPR) repeat protein
MVAALLMIALCYGALTFDRNRDWRNSLSLWTASVKDSPAGPTSHYNLGVELHRRGRDDEAIEHLKLACVLREEFPSAHGLLGNIYSAQGKYAAAIGEYEIGLAQAPNDARLKHNLAMAWFEKGKAHAERNETEMAVRSFLKTLKYEPGFEAAMEALEAFRNRNEPEHSPPIDPKPREAL